MFLKPTNNTERFTLACFSLFFIAAPVFLFQLIEIGHEFEWFLGILLFVSALLLLTPRLLKKYVGETSVYRIEFFLALAMLLSWIGSMGLYRWGIGYDSFVHFSASVLGALAVSEVVKTKKTSRRFWIVIVATLSLGLLIEFGEWLGDVVVGTSMYGEAGQPNDTLRDLVYDTLGAFVGGGIYIFHCCKKK